MEFSHRSIRVILCWDMWLRLPFSLWRKLCEVNLYYWIFEEKFQIFWININSLYIYLIVAFISAKVFKKLTLKK
jgi:hypothetical protein